MLTGIRLRLKALFCRRQFDQDLEDEMKFHLAIREEKLGVAAGEMNSAAQKDFGNSTLVRERCREMRSFVFLETLWQDIRYGARLLRHSPVFTAIAIITLALGIGANTAMFSLTYQVLLQLLPVPHPEELVILRSPGYKMGRTSSDGDGATSFSYPMYKEISERSNRVFFGVLARRAIALSVSGLGNTERANGELVSGTYFEVLGIPPALGRVFGPQDETSAGANPVAVLSYGYWTRHFGGDSSVLNKHINVNGTLLTIVGVSQAGFTGVQLGQLPDVFIPLTMQPQIELNSDPLESRRYHWAALIGRLRPGIGKAGAETALQVIFHPILEAEVPLEQIPLKQQPQFLARKLQLENGSHGRPIAQRDAHDPLIMLSAMTGLILIIACANLAGLLVARGEARQREIAVRLSLGASRARVLRQLLTEGLLLSLAGGLAGLAMAPPLLGMIIRSNPHNIGLNGLHWNLDLRLLFMALGLALATTMLFALMPALRLVHIRAELPLKQQSGSASAGASSGGLRKLLMISQVVFTTVLLAGAGLFTESLVNLRRVDLGMNPDHVVEFSIAPELNRYTPSQTVDLLERLRRQISALPGVRSVSAAENPVLAHSASSGGMTVEGYTPSDNDDVRAGENRIGPNYFSTLNIPLLAGREFQETDTAAAPQVAIINDKLAQKYFAGRDPLGKHIIFRQGNVRPDIEIVGVVRDSKNVNAREVIEPFAYMPYWQYPKMGHATIYVRASRKPASLSDALRNTVASLDHDLPVYNLMTLDQRRDESIYPERLMAALCLVMGSLAALLAALGLYGVMAYIVARRTREIGIRMALGATRSSVAWLVLREVMRMTFTGLVAGLGCALITGHMVRSQLFGVSGANPFILAVTASLLVMVALLAGSLPARRAAGVEPTVALRYE